MKLRYLTPLLFTLGLFLTTPLVHAADPPKAAAAVTITGRVLLDTNSSGKVDQGDKGVADVLVTDGVQFVKTAADGSYTLKLADDPVLPYQPARVISVSWPTGMWPVKQQWYARLSDIKKDESVDFLLREQKQSLPFTLVQGTDPHNDLTGSEKFRDDIDRMADKLAFCVITGDLGYIGRDSAEKSYASISEFSRKFPIPMMITPGNHDIADIHTDKWSEQNPLAGYGPYTRGLGPLRWSFNYAGVHIIGLDWARITSEGKLQTGVPDIVIDWVEKDLSQLPPGTRSFVFMHHHFRHDDDKFWDVLVKHKVELIMAGHSHRNLEQSRRGVRAVTTMNLCGPYRLLTVTEKSNIIIDRCFAGSGTAHAHSYAGKCKLTEWKALAGKGAILKEVADRELKAEAFKVDGAQGQGLDIVADIDPGTAGKFGLRLVPKDEKVKPFEVVIAGEQIQSGEVVTGAVVARNQKETNLRVLLHDGKVRVFANHRVHFEQAVQPGQDYSVTLFAEGGNATLKNLEVRDLKIETKK